MRFAIYAHKILKVIIKDEAFFDIRFIFYPVAKSDVIKNIIK
jgi:hypothetical protein